MLMVDTTDIVNGCQRGAIRRRGLALRAWLRALVHVWEREEWVQATYMQGGADRSESLNVAKSTSERIEHAAELN